MRKLRFVKRALVLAMCAVLAVPAVSVAWEPMVAEAGQTPGNITIPGGQINLTVTIPEETKKARAELVKELEVCYADYSTLMEAEDKTALATVVTDVKARIEKEAADGKSYECTDALAKELVESAKAKIKAAAGIIDTSAEADKDTADKSESVDTTPKTTNSNIMVGGNWVTPVAKAGNHVSVVLPVVNMGRTRVKNVVVTPQISEDAAKWPFEIETSNYTQTIDRCPGTDDGGTDMERRRELTWVLKTRKDAPSGYTPLVFDVTYEKDDKSLETIQLTTYVNVIGTTGKAADGSTSTPRVIVTGFSTNPEVVHAGETFTLTLHMQNTSKATAVKNMLFDIQAASESTESN